MSGKVFVVTGSNKGIGYAIVKELAEQVQEAVVYLTARNKSLGEQALKKIEGELGAKKRSDVRFHQLDITDEGSCKTLAAHIKSTHGELDVLVNNAGFAYPGSATESAKKQAEDTIGVNYYGTKRISNHLFPLLRNGGRVVNVCSQMGMMGGENSFQGQVTGYSDKWIQKFKDPAKYSVQDIDDFVQSYIKAAGENTRKENGFPESAYRVSKAAEIALTMLQSKELRGRNIIVNGCCPGYVNTDMTRGSGHLTIEEGADTPIYLATAADVPSGGFVYLRKLKNWN